MKPKILKECDRCGVKLVQWSNCQRLLTSHAEKRWDNPLYSDKRHSLLQSERSFQSKVCDHLAEKQDCLFADS